MTEFELWQYLYEYSQMTNGWWYSVAVLPATIISGCTYLLMLFALRRETRLPIVYLWLVIASVPLLLVLPSYYVNASLFDALGRVGFTTLPDNVQAINRTTTLQLGNYLNQVATLGIIGVSLAVIVIFASMLIGGYAPQQVMQAVQSVSQSFTKAMTRAFGNRKGGKATASSRYGVIQVIKGQQQGSQFGITNGAVIGKSEAAMTITDDIVSRRHARFEIRQDQPCLIDEGSTNGTFLVRNGAPQEVNGQAIALVHGDKIYLGEPDEADAVELCYTKSPEGDA
jgi:hypothetical protein